MPASYCPDTGDVIDITFDPQEGASSAGGARRWY